MPTNVFISWSGAQSKQYGEAIKKWLPSVLQFVRPYFSPDDIEKGTKWATEISANLEGSEIGIICLTKDNTESPWILFESGALSKKIDSSRVCPLLFEIEPSDLKGPLTTLQATKFNKEDFKKLVHTINNQGADAKLDASTLDRVFEKWWPELDSEVDLIRRKSSKGAIEEKRRDERDILEEVLDLTRLIAKQADGEKAFSKFEMRGGISPDVLFDLMLCIRRIVMASSSNTSAENQDHIIGNLKELERPLSYLSRRLGNSEVMELYKELFNWAARHFSRRFKEDSPNNDDMGF